MDDKTTEILYTCDNMACEKCVQCGSTTNISHAVNFRRIAGTNKYFELNYANPIWSARWDKVPKNQVD